MNNNTRGYRLADTSKEHNVLYYSEQVGYSTTKQSRVTFRINLNTFTDWKTKKKSMYIQLCRVNICYLSFCYLFLPQRVVVRVKEHDCSSRVWLPEREGLNGSLLR